MVISLREGPIELRCNFLERICDQMYSATKSSPNKKVPLWYVSSILKELKTEESQVTRNMIKFVFKKFCTKTSLEMERNMW